MSQLVLLTPASVCVDINDPLNSSKPTTPKQLDLQLVAVVYLAAALTTRHKQPLLLHLPGRLVIIVSLLLLLLLDTSTI
jgi:hypothetical protein